MRDDFFDEHRRQMRGMARFGAFMAICWLGIVVFVVGAIAYVVWRVLVTQGLI